MFHALTEIIDLRRDRKTWKLWQFLRRDSKTLIFFAVCQMKTWLQCVRSNLDSCIASNFHYSLADQMLIKEWNVGKCKCRDQRIPFCRFVKGVLLIKDFSDHGVSFWIAAYIRNVTAAASHFSGQTFCLKCISHISVCSSHLFSWCVLRNWLYGWMRN